MNTKKEKKEFVGIKYWFKSLFNLSKINYNVNLLKTLSNLVGNAIVNHHERISHVERGVDNLEQYVGGKIHQERVAKLEADIEMETLSKEKAERSSKTKVSKKKVTKKGKKK